MPTDTQTDLPYWRAIHLDLHVSTFAKIQEGFFRDVVEPTCQSVAEVVGPRPTSSNDIEHDDWERRRTIQMETHRSFALGIGAMWERNMRELLRQAGYILLEDKSAKMQKNIAGNGFTGIEDAFLAIRQFPLAWFSSYEVLRQLALLSSAIRHGDGTSAREIQDERSEWFLDQEIESGFYAYFAFGGDGPAAVRKVDISLSVLREFSVAIVRFWLQIDELRRNTGALEQEAKKPPHGSGGEVLW